MKELVKTMGIRDRVNIEIKKARRQKNLKEWRKELHSYLSQLKAEAERVEKTLSSRNYKKIKNGYYQERLEWPPEDDC